MAPNELQELQPIAEKLNEKSNQVNTIIAGLNAKLAALNVGLEVWLDPDDDHYAIGFAKVDEKWQLATRYAEEMKWVEDSSYVAEGFWSPERGTTCSVTPLLQASRELRIRALDYAKYIVHELKTKAKEGIASIEAAEKLVAEL